MNDILKGSKVDELIDDILSVEHESKTIEFKRVGGKKVVGKILETVVAMTNTDGGSILLGIDDPGKSNLTDRSRIVGIEESMESFDMFRQGVADIKPPFAEELEIHLLQDSQTGQYRSLSICGSIFQLPLKSCRCRQNNLGQDPLPWKMP